MRKAKQSTDELSTDQATVLLDAQKAQIEELRSSFFRLAQCRAADSVLHKGESWNDATVYINAEIAALDQRLMLLAPKPVEPLDEDQIVDDLAEQERRRAEQGV